MSKCSLDKNTKDLPSKTVNSKQLLRLSVNRNNLSNYSLESGSCSDDDICTSISQRPVNPLYKENLASRKIALPEANLLEDDRFWREQINTGDTRTELTNNQQDNQIFEMYSSETSADTFTPDKKKQRLPDSITKWIISLSGENLLIVGSEQDGGRPVAKICYRRISHNIFHDSNGTVCSLIGPMEPGSDIPRYVAEKFHLGLPEDWKNIIKIWRQYKLLDSPVKFRWPLFNTPLKKNEYETDTDVDLSTSLRADQLRKKISKMQTRLRAMEFRESLLEHTSKSTKTDNSTVNNSNSNRTSNILNMNIDRSAESSIKNIGNVFNFPLLRNKNIEVISFHEKKTSVQNINESSRTTDMQLRLSSSENSKPKNKSNSKENIESSDSGLEKPNQTIIQHSETKSKLGSKHISSGSEIFPNSKYETLKLSKNIEEESSRTFVSLNVLELNEELNAEKNKKEINKIQENPDNSKVTISSRGRKRANTVPFWKGSRLITTKDDTKLVQNKDKKLIHINKIAPEALDVENTEPVSNLNNPEEFLKPPDIEMAKKRSRKKVSDTRHKNDSPSKNKQSNNSPERKFVDKTIHKKDISKSPSDSKIVVENFVEVEAPKMTKKSIQSPKKYPEIQPQKSETKPVKSKSPQRINKEANLDSVNNQYGKSQSTIQTRVQNISLPEPIRIKNRTNISDCSVFLTPISTEKFKKSRHLKNSIKKCSLKAEEFLRPVGVKKSCTSTTDILKSIDVSRSSSNSSLFSDTSLSSRGRRRIPTLPFWQGHRVTIHGRDLVIEKSHIEKCTIDNYMNSESNISLPRNNNDTLSYDKVFNNTAFQKFKKKPVQMQLMSTLRDSLINKDVTSKEKSPKNNKETNKPENETVAIIEQPPSRKGTRSATKTKKNNEFHNQIEEISNNSNSLKKKTQFFNQLNHDEVEKQSNRTPIALIEEQTKKGTSKTPNKTASDKKQLINASKETVASSKKSPARKITRSATRANNNKHNIEEISNKKSESKRNSPLRKKSRSVCKQLNYDDDAEQLNHTPIIEEQTKNESFKTPNRTSKQSQISKSSSKKQLKLNTTTSTDDKTKSVVKKTATKRQKNIVDESKSVEKKKEENTPKRYETRQHPNINYSEKALMKSNKTKLQTPTIETTKNKSTKLNKSPIKLKSIQKTTKNKSQRSPRKNIKNFNFTVRDISNIEENIPESDFKMGPTKAAFKVPKPKKIKKDLLPTNSNELYLFVNKFKKQRKRDTRTIIPNTKVVTQSSPPKKRKLFENNTWIQSDECINYLSQNTPESEKANQKFIIKFGLSTGLIDSEDDKFSEISGVVFKEPL